MTKQKKPRMTCMLTSIKKFVCYILRVVQHILALPFEAKLLRKIIGTIRRCIHTYVARFLLIAKTVDLPVKKFIIPAKSSDERIKFAYLGDNKALIDVHYGAMMVVDLLDNSVAPAIIRTGWYEPWIDILIHSLVKEGDHAINIGANFGYHTMSIAKMVGPNGKVYAFECNPQLIDCLMRSFWISGFTPRIDLYHAAASHENGVAEMVFSREQIGGGRLIDTNNTQKLYQDDFNKIGWETCWGGRSNVEVKTITLDSIFAKNPVSIDFLLMDAEGCEPFIIQGGRETIQRSPNLKMIMEWSINPRKDAYSATQKKVIQETFAFLEEEKFKFYLICPPARGDARQIPPALKRISLDDLRTIPHCDLLVVR